MLDDTKKALATTPIFGGLSDDYLTRLASLINVESYKRGSYIFKEGDDGDKFYLIVEGRIRISRNVPGMGEEALAILKANDYFGEMALIDEAKRSADAYVHESAVVLALHKQDLEDLLFVDKNVAYDVLWAFVRTLSGRLRETSNKLTFLTISSKFG